MASRSIHVAVIFAFLPSILCANPTKTKDAEGRCVWTLTSYLKGTPEQIHELLNRDVDRMEKLVPQRQRELDDQKKTLESDRHIAEGRFKTTADYMRLSAALKQAEEELGYAQQIDDDHTIVLARKKVAELKFKLSKAREKWVEADEAVLLDHKRIAEDEKAIPEAEHTLFASIKWRDELIDAARVTFAMRGPVTIGSKGAIGMVVIVKVMDSKSVAVIYDAREVISESDKAEEGLVKEKFDHHLTALLLQGLDTKGMDQGQKMNIDRDFEVTGYDPTIGELGLFTAKVRDSDEDKLIRAITSH